MSTSSHSALHLICYFILYVTSSHRSIHPIRHFNLWLMSHFIQQVRQKLLNIRVGASSDKDLGNFQLLIGKVTNSGQGNLKIGDSLILWPGLGLIWNWSENNIQLGPGSLIIRHRVIMDIDLGWIIHFDANDRLDCFKAVHFRATINDSPKW